MANVELKVARIGNSRGVRLPAATLERYGVGVSVIMEERAEGILLRPTGAGARLSWEETARQMSADPEDWSEWDVSTGDGLAAVPWTNPGEQRVAEQATSYDKRKQKRRK